MLSVVKRDGRREEVSFDKVMRRIRGLSTGLSVNFMVIAQKVCSEIYDGVTTTELDNFAADICVSFITKHPDYGVLASRIVISNLHKSTPNSILTVVDALYRNVDIVGAPAPLVSEKYYSIIKKKSAAIEAKIDYNRDYLIDYFGFKTLERSYLMKVKNQIMERPQHMWMRCAIEIHGSNLERVFETYDLMSQKYFTHATPTLFNSGTPRPQLSSCFLIAMDSDSISGIYKTLGDCAKISQYAGGIGLHIHNIRAKGAFIRGTGGTSNGIVPMLRVFNDTARYVDQCFPMNTPIITQQGVKLIQNVGISDTVLTSNGTFQRVIKPVRHRYSGDMLAAVTSIGGQTYMTPEHTVLAITGQNTYDYEVIATKIRAGVLKPEWVTASTLAPRDYLVFSIPKYTADIPSITEEDCFFYGILLANHEDIIGSYSINKRGRIYCYPEEVSRLRVPCEYLEKRGVTVYKGDDYIEWDFMTPGFKFTIDDIFSGDAAKIPASFLHLPLNKIAKIIEGCLYSVDNENSIGDYFENELFPRELGYMCLRLGKVIRFTRSGPQVIGEIVEPNDSSIIRKDDYIFVEVDMIRRIENGGSQEVYDFEVEEIHDYTVADMGIAHNGGGKRKGSFAIYLEPWHADIEDFLRLKLNTGKEEDRARDLFYGLWIPDLFMERVEAKADWSLFCPDACPGLADVYGDDFRKLYEKYESEGRAMKKIPAAKLWMTIMESQIETGTPYMLYKDAANRKSNQQNIGVIKSSNLCTEIMEVSNRDETAVCNLCSICLPTFVKAGAFDFAELERIAGICARNLNNVIDVNYYPTEETKKSNMRHRPIGIGVQGLADVFALLEMPFESDAARDLNRRIFETIYYGALTVSCELAIEDGAYETFEGSPISRGELQHDMWGVKPTQYSEEKWDELRQKIVKNGVRNSLLIAPMPTASTSQIMGFNECFEPFTSNIYTRRTLAGEFILVNKYLIADLIKLGLWTEEIKTRIIASRGSIQSIEEIPVKIRELYKTVWEIKQRSLIDMSADRGAFICQSQSLNIFLETPTISQLTAMHFYGWRRGLKTGQYYLRTKPKVHAQQFTVDPGAASKGAAVAKVEDDGGCTVCSA